MSVVWKMKELITQYSHAGFSPSSPEDADIAAGEFKQNQLVRIKAYAVGKAWEPSVAQNNLMHACFDLVAENNSNPLLQSKEQVKFACKVALHFVYEDRVGVKPDGTIVFEYRSFCFAELKRMERLRIFDRAFDWCADLMGITVEEMIREAKSRMRKNYRAAA